MLSSLGVRIPTHEFANIQTMADDILSRTWRIPLWSHVDAVFTLVEFSEVSSEVIAN